MKKALNAWSCSKDHDFETVFTTLKKAGFDGVELNLDAEENASAHSLTFSTSDGDLRAILALSEACGLPVASISTSMYGNDTLGSEDPARRAVGRKVLEKQLYFAQALKADGILVVPGGIQENRSIRSAWDNSLASLRGMRSLIEGTPVKVGVENVWNNLFTSPFDMARFIDEADIPNVGAYFDVGNVAVFTWPEYWIDILGGRIVKIHVKDFRKEHNNSGTFVNLLEGGIRWGHVMSSLRQAGYDGYITAELSAMPETPEYLYSITKGALDVILDM